MHIPFHSNQNMELTARDKLYSAYLHVSMIVILLFSTLFFLLGYYFAALIQFLIFFPFIAAARLSVYNFNFLSKIIAVMASIFIVILQTNYFFTPASGFQYMLLPLVVVLFLINDLSQTSQKIFSISFSLVITVSFFLSTNVQIAGPIVVIPENRQLLFYNMSLLTAFISLSFMLYLYALQLSNKEKALSFLAEYDALTLIHNRGYFTNKGENLFSTYKEKKLPLSAIIFDIDNFKVINDTYGHHVGDLVLKQLSQTVKRQLNEGAIFARYGGEEFSILLENTTLDVSYILAERIRLDVENMCVLHGDTCIKFTVSLGIATLSDAHHKFEDIMKDADRALYVSKYKGKNKTWVINNQDVLPIFPN